MFFLAIVGLVILFFVYLIYKKHKTTEQEEAANQKPVINDDSKYSEILDTNIGRIKYYETVPAKVYYYPNTKAIPGISVTEDQYSRLLEYNKRKNMIGISRNWLPPSNIYGEMGWPGYE